MEIKYSLGRFLCPIYEAKSAICSENKKNPYVLMNGSSPDFSHIRVFGCGVLATKPSQKVRKLENKVERMILMGFNGKYMYRVFNPTSKRIEIIKHARFNESVFPVYEKVSVEANRHQNARYVTINLFNGFENEDIGEQNLSNTGISNDGESQNDDESNRDSVTDESEIQNVKQHLNLFEHIPSVCISSRIKNQAIKNGNVSALAATKKDNYTQIMSHR